MTWNELQNLTLERIQAQPRGFQARIAQHLGVSTASVAQWVTGSRPIPTERIHAVLEMLSLELIVQPRVEQGDV
jgi:DNA-binding transcriptional regulator YdaS (Cro superfamily)